MLVAKVAQDPLFGSRIPQISDFPCPVFVPFGPRSSLVNLFLRPILLDSFPSLAKIEFMTTQSYFWSDKSNYRARILWILLGVILAILAFVRPAKRTVTYHYSNATYHWWQGEDLYAFEGHGFLYFPQAVHLYAPFAWQKWPSDLHEFNRRPFTETLRTHFRLRMGEAFYRVVTVAFFAWSLFHLAGLINGRDGPSNSWFVISLLSLPAAVTAAANGQFNTLLSAAVIMGAVSVAKERWNWATFWLILAIIIKPHGVIALLLFGALYPRLWPRIPVGIAAFALIGFVHYDPGYVISQWRDFVKMLTVSTIPPGNTFDDISSLFSHFGIEISHGNWFYIRAVFAPLFLLVSFLLIRKTDPWLGPILVGGAFATYLMLFNPRTETVSFHILAPYIAALAAAFTRADVRTWLSWLLVFLCIGWGSDNYGDIYKITRLWWKPFLTFIFMVVLFYWAFAKNTVIEKVSLRGD